MSSSMDGTKRRLAFVLSQLHCPAYLPPKEERIASPAFRRTLLLWLYALYKRPALLGASDDTWARQEPTADELVHWLRMVLGLGSDSDVDMLLEAVELQPCVLKQLIEVVETVYGAVTVHQQGDTTVLHDASTLISDIAQHQDAVFDDRCEIFPISVQLMAKEMHRSVGQSQLATRFDDDLAALQRQLEAVEARITTAVDRLRTLQTAPVDSLEAAERDSKALSHELSQYLLDCAELIDSVTAMFKGELAPWMNPPSPHLVGVGEAAATAYDSINHILRFLETAQSFSDARRDQRHVQAALDVAKDCQTLVERITPTLRDQLHALEMALATH